MTIRKGEPWGEPAALPPAAPLASTDAEVRRLLLAARAGGTVPPVIGLLGGDLCRTLGGGAETAEGRRSTGVMFPLDVGTVTFDGRSSVFVAHAVARTRNWTRVVAALNAQWLGRWNAGPRAHPNDGLLDTYDVRLAMSELGKVRARLPTGSHLPHPGIVERRSATARFQLDRPLRLWLDGVDVGKVRSLIFGIEPDALRVVV